LRLLAAFQNLGVVLLALHLARNCDLSPDEFYFHQYHLVNRSLQKIPSLRHLWNIWRYCVLCSTRANFLKENLTPFDRSTKQDTIIDMLDLLSHSLSCTFFSSQQGISFPPIPHPKRWSRLRPRFNLVAHAVSV